MTQTQQDDTKCPRCQGKGYVHDGKGNYEDPCYLCDGTGRRLPEKEKSNEEDKK